MKKLGLLIVMSIIALNCFASPCIGPGDGSTSYNHNRKMTKDVDIWYSYCYLNFWYKTAKKDSVYGFVTYNCNIGNSHVLEGLSRDGCLNGSWDDAMNNSFEVE